MTWTVKIRSSPGALMASDYECPKHGRFTATVPRDEKGDPPETEACPYVEVTERWMAAGPPDYSGPRPTIEIREECRQLCPWRISMPAVHTQFVISASQGKSAPKPHREALDTRPLAEGRRKEWRQARKKLREERRHARVKEYLK